LVRIRLKRMGRKKLPVYKVVVAHAHSKRDGKTIDILGTYNPKTKEFDIDTDKLKEWLSKGAQPTGRVSALLKSVKEVEDVRSQGNG